MNNEQYIAAVEAILFSVGESIELSRIADALELSEKEAREVIEALASKYENDDKCGLRIVRLEDSYQMCSKTAFYDYLIKVTKQPRNNNLSDVVLETLSIVAYKQPVTRAEIESIRGVSCSHAINKLIEYNLIEEVGRLETPGRPILFGTTEDFLRCFGVASTEELPSLDTDKMEEFKQEAINESIKRFDEQN